MSHTRGMLRFFMDAFDGENSATFPLDEGYISRRMPFMKTQLDHIPEHKRQEILRAVDKIREATKPEMIILFGSYARGDWVEEEGPDGNYQYQSDYDLLVITETEHQAKKVEGNRTLWNEVRSMIRTPISLIAEDIKFINRRLGKGQYFYIDIKEQGILLYDSGKHTLAEPKELHPNERRAQAKEEFKQWVTSAKEFMDIYAFCFQQGHLNKAAFNLHQATESLYAAILLVYTRYKPNSHDLKELSKRITSFEPQFLTIFPQGSEEQKHRFELLRKAYVDARYKASYTINQEELQWLEERINLLSEMTEKLCAEKIASYGLEER